MAVIVVMCGDVSEKVDSGSEKVQQFYAIGYVLRRYKKQPVSYVITGLRQDGHVTVWVRVIPLNGRCRGPADG